MVEGDDHHPISNRNKMVRGEPLSDDDRGPWVDALAKAINVVEPGVVILACSALTSFVRDRLTLQSIRPCRWFLLTAPTDELRRRMEERAGHFMPASLLASQLTALVPPHEAFQIDATLVPDAICDAILAQLA